MYASLRLKLLSLLSAANRTAESSITPHREGSHGSKEAEDQEARHEEKDDQEAHHAEKAIAISSLISASGSTETSGRFRLGYSSTRTPAFTAVSMGSTPSGGSLSRASDPE